MQRVGQSLVEVGGEFLVVLQGGGCGEDEVKAGVSVEW